MSTVYEKVLIAFENNILDNLRSDSITGKLVKDGRLRERLRAEMHELVKTTGLDLQDQVNFLRLAGKSFEKYGEYSMAQNAMEMVLDKCACIPDTLLATKTEIEALHAVARCTYSGIVASDQYQLAPMAIGKVLGCLQKLCTSLDLFLGLSTKEQEAHAYLVLNSCKLLFDMGHPLIWISCGKYIIEMFLFGILCMNSVINLCTPRHLNFRMKMYSSVFLAAVTQDTSDMATVVLNHAGAAVKELRTREELETPVPELTLRILGNAECDLDVLKQVLGFWKDADAFDPKSFAAAAGRYPDTRDKNLFTEKCLLECCRVQQLTTGNINEPWKKRSRGLLKAFIAFSEADGFDLGDVSVRCVSDMMSTILFDIVADETAVGKLRVLMSRKVEEYFPKDVTDDAEKDQVVTTESEFDIKQLSLLNQLLVVMDSRTLTNQNVTLVKNYLSDIAKVSFTEELMKRRTFLQRAAIGVWNRCIFPAVRQALSRSTSQRDQLKMLSGPLLSIMEILSSTLSHDSVFVGSVAVITAQVLRAIGQSRECIQHVLRSLDYVEGHRAGRVDIRLQYPEEVRDITSLQHQAISVRTEYKNWFHAFKRLGAHAFAGFGIFGASSSMYREDVALSEIHMDLLTCYFGEEIAYAIAQRHLRGSDVVEHKTKNVAATKNGTKAATVAQPTPIVKIEDPEANEESKCVAKVSNMAISKQLRNWCKKNNYAKCLLLLEMARVEALSEERLALVAEAMKCVELAEQREKEIIDAFADLTIMTDREIKHPIVLTRSHKFFYVLPVGCRAQRKAHYYKILAREEGSGTDLGPGSDELAGCDIRVLTSSLQYPSSMTAVRVEVPVANEKYVFGSAAFKENGQLLAHNALSPTSIPVEAVNPISTIMLWGQIAQIAALLDDTLELARKAAEVVCTRYFLNAPKPKIKSIGRMGYNLFVCDEPVISALVVNQSSEQQLYTLVKSFIIAQQSEESGFERTLREIPVHGALRADFQVEILNILKRLALITTIASYIKSHELVSQCAYLGYNICSQLLREEDISLAAYTSQALIVLIAALQQIPKRQWHDLEHEIFCRITVEAVKCAIVTRNVEAFSRLLERIHPDESPPISDLKSEAVNISYDALMAALHQGRNFFMTPDIRRQLARITLSDESPRDLQLWAIPFVRRNQILRGMAADCVAVKSGATAPPAGKDLKKQASTLPKGSSVIASPLDSGPISHTADQVVQAWSAAKPHRMSDLISSVVLWAKELSASAKYDLVIALVQLFPIKRCQLTPDVQKLCKEWKLDFLDASEPPPVVSDESTGGKKSPRSASESASASRPGTANSADNESADEFNSTQAVESTFQMKLIAELSLILANIAMLSADVARELDAGYVDDVDSVIIKPSQILPNFARRQYYPKSLDGPVATLDIHDPHSAISDEDISNFVEQPKSGINEDSEEPVASQKMKPNPLVALRYICCAIVLFNRCGCTSAAIDASCRLWNIVVDGWVHPKTFALECMVAADPNPAAPTEVSQEYTEQSPEAVVEHVRPLSIQDSVIAATESLAHVLEVISRIFEDEDLGAADQAFFPGQSIENTVETATAVLVTCTDRESKEYLYSVRNISNYLIKVIWLFRSWKDVVSIGTRITSVYAQKSTLDISRSIMESTWGYILHAQTQLMEVARGTASAKQSELDQYIADWEDAQSKKRKKKARIARAEKDADEVAYELKRGELENEVQRLNTLFQVEQNHFDGFSLDQKRILGSQPIGIQLLDRVRRLYQDFMMECHTKLSADAMKHIFDPAAWDPLQGSCLLPLNKQKQDAFANVLKSDRALELKFDGIQHDYDAIASFFREKKDIVGLVEGLHEQGDVLLLFGKATEARSVWNDAVDGIFHAIDSVKQWQRLMATATSHHSGASYTHFVTCMFPVVAILGKLSVFCATNDFDKKSDYCRLAATICQVPFSESIHHPKNLPGFATYECLELGGVGYLLCNESRLSAAALSFSLDEILNVLIAEDEWLLALPCVVLVEHLHACYTMRADKWMHGRLLRIRILVKLHFFSEAASMIAGISSGLQMVAARKHNLPLAEFEAIRCNAPPLDHAEAKSMFEASENGFDYFGLAPYWNNLPPNSDKNIAAISWIKNYANSLWELIRANPLLKMDLPASMLPREPEPPAALTKADSKMPLTKASSTLKQQPSVKGQPSMLKQTSTMGGAEIDRFGSVIDESNAPGIDSLISGRDISALKIECMGFLSELLELDTKILSKSRPFVDELTGSTEAELSNLVRMLVTDLESAKDADPDDPFSNDTSGQPSPRVAFAQRNRWCEQGWVNQFCRANLSLISLLMNQKRHLIAARAGLVCFQKVLVGGMDSAQKETGGCVPYKILFIVKNTWVRANFMLADISGRQGRFEDAVSIASRGATEVSGMCWSHWLRHFLSYRSKVLLKLGKLDSCEVDCNTIMASFDYNCDVLLNGPPKQLYVSHSASHTDDRQSSTAPISDRTRVTMLLARTLVQKASVLKMKSVNESSIDAAHRSLRDCIKLTKEAIMICQRLVAAVGFLGSDSNITFNFKADGAASGMVSRHHLLPPLMHSLTDIHPNDPILSIEPTTVSAKIANTTSRSTTTIVNNINQKPSSLDVASDTDSLFSETMKISRVGVLSQYSGNVSFGFFHRPDLRLGPVDSIGHSGEEVVYSASEFANINLSEVRYLAICIAALGKIVMDAEPLIAADREKQIAVAKKGNAPQLHDKDERDAGSGSDKISIDIFTEMVTEEGLKLLRHIYSPSVFLRSSLLLHAGVFRSRPRISNGNSSNIGRVASNTMLSPVKGGRVLAALGGLQPDLVPGEAKGFDDFSRMGWACVDPLRKGLEICVAGNVNPWEIMRMMCVELVEKYGSDRIDWADDAAECNPMYRLSLSAYFLKLAIHLNGCIRNLNETPLEMTADKSFSDPCPQDIVKMLESFTSSSVSSDRQPGAPQAPLSPTKGSKAPPATSSPPSTQLTGRDALFALSGLCRETDPLWLDGYEYDYISDLHASLASAFPVYTEKCSLKEVPNTKSIQLNVQIGSISSLWVLASTEETRSRHGANGIFDGVTGYFLLGAVANASSSDPLLTKTSLSYTEVVKLENEAAVLRDHILLGSLAYERIAERCQELLVQLYTLLKHDSGNNDLSTEVKHEGDHWCVDLRETKSGRGGNGKVITFQISAASLTAMASAFSYRTGSSDISDPSVSAVLWLVLSVS